jgi:GNAT superfamily N-acetyltransferase
MTMTIRRASPTDLPRVLELYQQPALDDGAGLSLEAATHQLEIMKNYPNYGLYVAVMDDQIVGTFALLIMNNVIHSGAPSGIAEAVAVAPDDQGQGIGRTMMQWAIAQCQAAGCYKLVISAHLKRDRAHAFYESLGFTKHGYSFVMKLPSEIA